jgi:tetratricopeptide (TPR) repeat protein
MGALTAVGADSRARWSAEDVRARMEFALRSAYAHGTRAIRTHLDSYAPQDDISFGVFREVRADWADRITLQAACLIGAEQCDPDGPFAHTADVVSESGGILGMVTYPMSDIADRIRAFFDMASARGLTADFHVDETLDTTSNTLRQIAEAVIETGYDAPVVVGHCCSVSAMAEAEAFVAENNHEDALAVYKEVLAQDPSHVKALGGALRAYLALGQDDLAKQVLADLPEQMKNAPDVAGVQAALDLKEQSAQVAGGADLSALEAKVAADPKDMQSRLDLAVARYGAGAREQAMDELLEMVRKDRKWNEEAARKQLVKFFEALGPADPLAVQGRRRLSSILFA